MDDNPNAHDTITPERDAFIERIIEATAGTFTIFSVYLGDQLGFYRALAARDTMTPAELATATGTHTRYVREWLEQQTVAGILTVMDADAASDERQFRLPPGHREPLVDPDSLNFIAPLAQLLVAVTRPLDQLLAAYRTGQGVPLAAYGRDFREGQAAINRPAFLQQLGQEWLPALPTLHARLQATPPARVAEIGCGAGWAAIGIAQVYPQVLVDGFDLDGPSIDLAQANAAAAGLQERVRFHVQDAGAPALVGQYDLVAAFECVHDMADPVGALRTMRRLAGETGTVLIVDERVGPTFTPTGNDVEWMMYGWSVLHCLPVGMAEQPSAATGTVMRPALLRTYALAAGFQEVEILPIEHFFFQFYQLC